MENDSSSAGSDSSSSSMESSDSQQISNAQQEVQDTTSCGNSDVGSYDQIKQNTADLEQQGTLPSLSLDDAQSQQSDNNSAMAQMEEYSGEDEDDDAVDTSSENTSAENAVNNDSNNGSSAENAVNDGSINGSSAENAVNDGSINGSSANTVNDGSINGSPANTVNDGSINGSPANTVNDGSINGSSANTVNDGSINGSSENAVNDGSNNGSSAENAVNDGSNNGSSAENAFNNDSNNGSSAENAVNDGSINWSSANTVNDGSINGSSAEADAMKANDGSQIDNNQNSAMAQMEEYSEEDEDDDAVDTSSENKSGEGGGNEPAVDDSAMAQMEEYSGEVEDDDAVDTPSKNTSGEGGGDEPAVEENGCANEGKQDRSFMENFRSSVAQNFAAAGIAASSMFTPSSDLATNMSKQPETAAQTQIVDSGLQVHGMNYDERADKPAPSPEQKPARECESMDKTVADGRMVPSLTVKFAGLPESQSYGSLSAFPVDNNDKPDEQTFATTAHGFTKLPNQTIDKRYDTLDDGFKNIDSDKNGSASQEELKSKLNDSSESFNHQIQYVLDNYDKIAETSKSLDPSATGVTNEGLAQHYMENAQITVNTPNGTSFPAHVEFGNRNTDVAILKATDLTPDQKDSVGKNFEIAPKDASKNDFVTSYGHVRGIEQAEKLCHIPNQTSGLVTTDKEKGQLIPGDVQQAKLGTMAGMSGGPVVNANDNKVVGMNHAGWDEAVNKFFVPASAIKEGMEKAMLKKR